MIFKAENILFLFLSSISFFTFCSILDSHENVKTYIEILNDEIDKLGKAYKLPVLDTYSIFLDENHNANPIYFSPKDGLHLSGTGYQTWATKVLLPFLYVNNFTTIAMVGNSITRGAESYDFGKKDSATSNWELLLNVKTFNLGVGGNSSFDIINRLDNIVSHKADCYFLLIGINDINKGIQIWETVDNIEFIINYFSVKKLKLVLQYVMPVC